MSTHKANRNVLFPFLFVAICAFSITRSVSDLHLSPDSSSYINVAQNIILTGHIYVFTNFPSRSMEPVTEPYTEQPIGFPAYLLPFLWIFKQPFVAAAIAQAFSMILLYGAVWFLTKDLQVGPGFQVACALAITLFRPLAFVFVHLWSETLFIALTLWAIHFLLIAGRSQKPLKYWLIAFCLAAAATATRSIGILSLGIFIVAFWNQPTGSSKFKSRLALIGLSCLFLLGPLAAWSLRNKVIYGSTSMVHTLMNLFSWKTLLAPFNYIFDMAGSIPFTRLLITGFSLICLASLFLLPGKTGTGSRRLKIYFSKVRAPSLLLGLLGIIIIFITLIVDQFDGPSDIGVKKSLMIDFGLLCILTGWLMNTNILECVKVWKENYDWGWWHTQDAYGYKLIISGGFFHLFGIIALSQITPFSELQDRLLAPALTLLLLALLLGLRQLAGLVHTRVFIIGVLCTVFILALISPAIVKGDILFKPGFHNPPEQMLWQKLNTYPGITRVSHFYTDTDFTHEIYARLPQRIITDETSLLQNGYLDSLMSKGTCPFVLVETGDPLSRVMNKVYKKSGLNRYVLLDGLFELYAQKCLFTP